MTGKRLEEEIMPERFKDQEWTFDERILEREVLVIPNSLAL